MVRAFVIYSDVFAAKLKFLLEKTSEKELKLLSILCQKKDYSKIGTFLRSNATTRVVQIDKNILYIIDDIRIQLEEVDYYG